MDREVNVELIRYRDLQIWKPAIGDIIIKHGWIIRTKWFGVINSISPVGDLNIIRDGMMRLLVMTTPTSFDNKSISLSAGIIKSSMPGSYAVLQQDTASKMAIWYV
jgi:hypothetical protein